MGDINKSMATLNYLEYSGRTEKMLHHNEEEDGLTYCGIYQSAHPNWDGWEIIEECLESMFSNWRDWEDEEKTANLKICSRTLAKISELQDMVNQFYKTKFWDEARLDEVESQKIADEIFIFGVNVGMSVAIKKAQKLVGVAADGVVGKMTLKALNSFDVITFDDKFDDLEEAYYDAVIEAKPYLAINRDGWYNRAEYV